VKCKIETGRPQGGGTEETFALEEALLYAK
jgi:hypothetical protein